MIKALFFFLIVFLYVLVLKYLERREVRNTQFSDEEYLAGMAVDQGCSELEIFRLCAQQWHAAPQQIEQDFKQYLHQGHLPHYVRDYIRKNKKRLNPRVRSHLDPGGNLPSSWMA